MTRVTLYLGQDGSLAGYQCDGHAGYAKSGKDIVCAAISLLATSCANALESVAGVQPDVEQSEGHMRVMLPPGQATREAQVILQVFRQGVYDLRESYPKHIHITTR